MRECTLGTLLITVTYFLVVSIVANWVASLILPLLPSTTFGNASTLLVDRVTHFGLSATIYCTTLRYLGYRPRFSVALWSWTDLDEQEK